MIETYNKIKNETILNAGTKNNILTIETDKETYKIDSEFLNHYRVYAILSKYHDPKWHIKKWSEVC